MRAFCPICLEPHDVLSPLAPGDMAWVDEKGHRLVVGELPVFTWDDVDFLREVEAEADVNGHRVGSIADRIVALLPPRE